MMETMNIEAFKRQSVLGWGVVIFLTGFALFAIGFITVPAIQWQITSPEFRSNLGSSPLPDDWRWSQIVLADLGILLTIGYLSLQPVAQLLTKFTEEGVEQPTFFRNKEIYWRDVQKIQNITTANIEIHSAKAKINLNPNMFTDAHALINELRLRAPSAFPSDEKISQEVHQQKRDAARRVAIGTFGISVFVFIFAKDVVAYTFGLLMLGYGVFEVRKWVKLGRNP